MFTIFIVFISLCLCCCRTSCLEQPAGGCATVHVRSSSSLLLFRRRLKA